MSDHFAKSPTGPRASGPALEAMYQFLLWLVPVLEKFPRSQKFLLGDRLQVQALAVLDQLIEATYSKDRIGYLRAANLGLEKLRFGVRMAKDLRHLDLARYEFAARAIDNIGRMVGAWLKQDKQQDKPQNQPQTKQQDQPTPQTAPSLA